MESLYAHGFGLAAVVGLDERSVQQLVAVNHSDGTPVFVGTRVPLQNLIDSLEGGESIEDFLSGFPTVKREQVVAVIEASKLTMLDLMAHAHPH